MNRSTNWHSQLVAWGANSDSNSRVSNFGDSAAELRALQTTAVLVPLTHLGIIEVSGKDAQSFLNTQLTSDVVQVTPESAQFSGYCTPKGRLLATFLICQRGSDYLLLLPLEIAEATAASLRRYVLRAKVDIALATDAFSLLGIAGPQASTAVTGGINTPGSKLLEVVTYDAVNLITLPGNAYLAICSEDKTAEHWSALRKQASPAGADAWELQSIRTGIATVTANSQEAYIPQMLGLENIGAVSFEKGCYPGQEIVARTQYLGNLKRQLYYGHSDQALKSGDQILSGNDKTVGTVTNAAPSPDDGWEFLAVLQRDAIEAGSALRSEHSQSVRIDRLAADLVSEAGR